MSSEINTPKMAFIEVLRKQPATTKREQLHLFVRQKLMAFLGLDSLDEVAENQNAQALGIDSMQAVEFKMILEKELGISLRTTVMLEYQELDALVDFLLQALSSDLVEDVDLGLCDEAGPAPEFVPVTEVQRGLWYIMATRPDSSGFNIPLLARVNEPLDEDVLQQVYLSLLDDYPILRASFVYDETGRELLHRVHPAAPLADIARTVCSQNEVDPWLRLQLRRPFAADATQLIRLAIAEVTDNGQTVVQFTLHHLICDGLSGVLFIRELWTRYDRIIAGEARGDRQPDRGFFQFVDWQRDYLAGPRAQEDRQWWLDHLKGMPTSVALPYDRVPALGRGGQGIGSISFRIDGERRERIKEFTKDTKIRRSTVMMAAFAIMLYKLTNQRDLPMTTPIAGRPDRSHFKSMGCFINLVVTRARIVPSQSMIEFARSVADSFTGSLVHGDYPFPHLVTALGLSLSDPTDTPFPVSFTYQNIFSRVENWKSKTDLSLDLSISQETEDAYTCEIHDRKHFLDLNFKYQQDRFDEATIRRHGTYFLRVLDALIANPEQSISDFDMVPPDERRRVVFGFNQTQVDAVDELCVHERFVREAGLRPERPALVYGDRVVTYGELELASRALAVQLQHNGVKAGDFVAICMERSPEAIVAMLAVLRAGAAWLPLDPVHTSDRLRFMIDDVGAAVVLTDDAAGAIAVEEARVDCPRLPVSGWASSDAASAEPRVRVPASYPAYCIYTSGSTGRPKGVVVGHGALANLSQAMIAAYQIEAGDRVLQFASLSFDMAVEEIFPYLTRGAGVVLRRESDLQAHAFFETVMSGQVSILNLPPLFYSVLSELYPRQQQELFQQVRLVSFGGEALPVSTLTAMKRFPCRVFNAYGPTEATVNAAIADLTEESEPLIGQGIANTQLYVLDGDLRPVPIGVVGELHIGGAGLAQGYLGQPDLTKDKFIPNPFGSGQLYKTGDFVRWGDDGRLRFIGRRDEQVKVRGHRVELGEVERAFGKIGGVRLAAVIDVPGPHGKQLSGFYVPVEPGAVRDVRQALRRILPEYMVPTHIVELERIPKTANGKIDRKALQAIELPKAPRATPTPPRGELESALVSIWEDVLAASPVGVQDDFFDLGGHSLLAIQIAGRVATELPRYQMHVRDVLEYPTIEALAQALERRSHGGQGQTSNPYVVVLRPGSQDDVHVIIPGMPGLADGYHQLAEALPPGGAVFGLQMRGFMGEPPCETLEDMAAHNWDLIRSLNPRGSINLYAHSYGGLVVYEMLRQAGAWGTRLDKLVLIDSAILAGPEAIGSQTVRLFCDNVIRILRIDAKSFYARIDEVFHLPREHWKTEIVKVFRASETPVGKRVFNSVMNLLESSLSIQYCPSETLPFAVHAIRSGDQLFRSLPGQIRWQEYFRRVETFDASGDHFTVNHKPHVDQWVGRLFPAASEPSLRRHSV